MKKILLATTALVGFAGAAAAEIKLDGYAEMGVDGGSQGYNTQFHNDWQVNFNFSGATDGGLEFGGKVQIEESNSPQNTNGPLKTDDEQLWVSGSFGKVTLGEIAGAIDWAVPDVISNGTAISDDHSTHAGAYWNSGMDGRYDNQIMRYEYSFGDWAAAASVEMDDSGVLDPIIGVGAKWSGSMSGADVTAGIGYQSNGDDDTWSLAANATMANGLGFGIGYADFSHKAGNPNFQLVSYVSDANGNNNVDVDSWVGVGVSYTTGALKVGANYGVYSAANAGDEDPSGWGLVANYDLGGGAVVMVGYGSSDGNNAGGGAYGNGNGHGTETWSAGLGMSF